MGKTLTLLLGAALAAALLGQAVSARTGTPVVLQGTLNFLEPEEEALTVVEDPAGVLCPNGVGQAARSAGDGSRAPHPRGQSDRFVGTVLLLVTCGGEGWGASDTYTLRVTVKGTGPTTAEGTWSIVEATGRLSGLHGGGEYRGVIDPFPVVTNTYTGTVQMAP
ncbi:MAG: hypothetical protein ACRDNY_08135 [Gaiellaceae bacterium]